MAQQTALTKEQDTAIIPVEFQALGITPRELQEILTANAGEGTLNLEELGRIKVPAGGATTWTIPTLGGEEETKVLQVVIVAWRDQRALWLSSLDTSDGPKPPDCSSRDAVCGSLKREEITVLAQANDLIQPGEVSPDSRPQDCQTCPFAKFGTARGSKGRGQWCKATRALYVLFPDSMLPTALTVPPKSIKPIRSYFLQLASKGLPYYGVVTHLNLQKSKNADGIAYSEIMPQVGTILPEEARGKFRAYHQAIEPFVKNEPVVIDGDGLED